MANQHQHPNRPANTEDRVRSQQPTLGKRTGETRPTDAIPRRDPAGAPGTKGDPPSRRPGEYPDTTPDVVAGNQSRRANANRPAGRGSEDKRRSGEPDRSRGDRSGDESNDEPTDRR